MILGFGRYKDHDLKDIPDDYLFYLCSRGKSTYYKSTHSLDVRWKVPFFVGEAARAEADRRGFTLNGERWVRKRG